MKIVLVSKCSLDIEQHVEFEMSVLISPSKSLISSCWVTIGGKVCEYKYLLIAYLVSCCPVTEKTISKFQTYQRFHFPPRHKCICRVKTSPGT